MLNFTILYDHNYIPCINKQVISIILGLLISTPNVHLLEHATQKGVNLTLLVILI
jgi:hypothetical protein